MKSEAKLSLIQRRFSYNFCVGGGGVKMILVKISLTQKRSNGFSKLAFNYYENRFQNGARARALQEKGDLTENIVLNTFFKYARLLLLLKRTMNGKGVSEKKLPRCYCK